MENQQQQISGYRELSQTEIDLINKIKAFGPQLNSLIYDINAHLSAQMVAAANAEQGGDISEAARLDMAQPSRWVSISRTHFQEGLMALTRAVAQPTFF